jgi:hypothetical protein
MILRRTHEMVSGDLSAALARQASTENTVLSLQTQVADYTLDGERFALLSAWGGRQEITLDSRRISVDDDTWLPIPSGPATVRIRGSEPVNVLTVLFRKGMPEEVLGAMITPEDRLLDDGEVHGTSTLPFIPHLQTHARPWRAGASCCHSSRDLAASVIGHRFHSLQLRQAVDAG